jgi:hypothetical protein
VYFVSKALHGAEERYPKIKKLAFGLIITSRKLWPYFKLTPFEFVQNIHSER